jgi:hypothetical protein
LKVQESIGPFKDAILRGWERIARRQNALGTRLLLLRHLEKNVGRVSLGDEPGRAIERGNALEDIRTPWTAAA